MNILTIFAQLLRRFLPRENRRKLACNINMKSKLFKIIWRDCAHCHSMFNNPTFADLQISLRSGILLPAHRIILAAESLYFKKAFEHKFKEAEEGVFKFKEQLPHAL